MPTRDVPLQAALVDHEHRLAAIEEALGMAVAALPRNRLLELYEDALNPTPLDAGSARGWARHALALDVSSLIVLIQHTGDPFPWQGILARLDVLHAQGFEVTDAVEHVERLARGTLKAQGLDLIRPRDVMGHGPLRYRAIGAIRKRMETT
jgi:hypothetical protein